MGLGAAILLLASLPGPARAGYVHHRGFIPLGDDCFNMSATTTLAAALAACTADAACRAFTYEGNSSGPSAAAKSIYFKNATGARNFMGNASSDWTTFTKTEGPCDIYHAAGTPCVAAHSLTRALYGNYSGPLYAVKRASDGAVRNISVLPAGNVADAAAQDAFCAGSSCIVLRIFDQSPRRNHLHIAQKGGHVPTVDHGVNASRAAFSLGGATVYAAYFEGGMGYRNDNTSGVATGVQEETLYMVTSGQHFNAGCCFDYGNAETNNHDDGTGTMEAVYWGNNEIWGRGSGEGPWVMADLENGLWAGEQRVTPSNTALTYPFVTAMVKGGKNGFALKAGDATQGHLQLMYDGPRPHVGKNGTGYQPMQKQGAIILGIGGDNSDSAIGTFFEGVITSGYTTDAADDAVQANIVAAGYSEAGGGGSGRVGQR